MHTTQWKHIHMDMLVLGDTPRGHEMCNNSRSRSSSGRSRSDRTSVKGKYICNIGNSILRASLYTNDRTLIRSRSLYLSLTRSLASSSCHTSRMVGLTCVRVCMCMSVAHSYNTGLHCCRLQINATYIQHRAHSEQRTKTASSRHRYRSRHRHPVLLMLSSFSTSISTLALWTLPRPPTK